MWRQAGISIIPILDNGTKKPAVRWAEFQARSPEPGEVEQWWSNGRQYGLAIICGSISGNLEMTEIEGRAATAGSLLKIEQAMEQVGATAIWNSLTTHGYMEMSPSGGIHFLYRVCDANVPGNQKIAVGPDHQVLAETRGEGGYVIVAPTSGLCHPTGDSWTLLKGEIGQLPQLTWRERCLLHEGLKLALDDPPASAALAVVRPAPSLTPPPIQEASGAGLSPNDDFEARTDWAEILEPHGWRLESERNGERYWTRPDKDPRLGASATTGYHGDRDRLYVFSTSTVFQAEVSYTKYMAWTILNFGGDKQSATRELVRRGFGSPAVVGELAEVAWPTDKPSYEANDTGNAAHLRDRIKGHFLWVHEERVYYRWDGQVWQPDFKGYLVREYQALCREMSQVGGDSKRWTVAANNGKVTAALNLLRTEPGVTVLSKELNLGSCLLNLPNGIFDLRRMELEPHDPDLRQTRMFGAAYEPSATCPNFENFIMQAVPTPELRDYVQRALGYSLLGDVDHRAMFLIYGPSGTGKSTLMETMRYVFGDYGTTAASGTFRARGRDGVSVTNDLHGLRNKRFVTTSETAEGSLFDEDLLKRLTGRDSVVSRELYQANQEWTPECVLWMATNHPPKFNSDDDAIWRRAKLIPFTTPFSGDGEIFDMARRVLAKEASGIFNWLLAGLAAYLVRGLDEPDCVVSALNDLRSESDSVVKFLEDQVSNGVLVLHEHGKISSKELFMLYQSWCFGFSERPLRTRRFAHRLESAGKGVRRDETSSMYLGVGRAGLLATQQTYAYASDAD